MCFIRMHTSKMLNLDLFVFNNFLFQVTVQRVSKVIRLVSLQGDQVSQVKIPRTSKVIRLVFHREIRLRKLRSLGRLNLSGWFPKGDQVRQVTVPRASKVIRLVSLERLGYESYGAQGVLSYQIGFPREIRLCKLRSLGCLKLSDWFPQGDQVMQVMVPRAYLYPTHV